MSSRTPILWQLGKHGHRPARRRQRGRPGRQTRSLRLECLEDRRLLAVLEVMPTSPFIVSPFIDPLVIPAALAPGWRKPDGSLAPNDNNAWSVRQTHFAGATPTGDPVRPSISPPGPGVNQQDSIGLVPAIPGLFEQHEGQHQVWPNAAGQNSDRLVGLEGGPYPDPILYHIRTQVAEHDFTSSRVVPITALGTPVAPQYLPAGVVLDGNGTAELPSSTIYGFNGTFPGSMINSEYGQPILVRFENDLDLNPQNLDRQDFGDPAWKSLTHLHNAHTAPESDGNPFYMQQNGGGYLPGQWSDNLYLNYPAGGDPNEKQSLLWFHDHVEMQTGADVYKGLVGLNPIYDPKLDPGDERDPNGLGLPGIKTVNPDGSFDVKYDIPMAFYDVALDDGVTVHDDMHTLPQNVETHPEWWGKSFYQHNADTGLVGDIFTINGTAFPVLEVDQRQYRFRFLDASVSRIYELAMMTSDAGPVAMPGTQGQWQIPDGQQWRPFTQIASMGGLLPEPLQRDSVQIWPATRNEHVVDFSNVPTGTVIYLTNILEMPDGRKPNFNDPADSVNLANYKVPMMKIIVGGPPPVGEEGPTSVPSHLRPMPVLPSPAVLDALPHPEFTLGRSGRLGFENQWLINDKLFDRLVPLHTVTRGQPEVWTVTNGGGGWVHPMHMHQEEHTVLTRVNSTNQHPDDTGKSDTVNLDENESVTFYRNFRTFTGRYVGHCHNLLHEDHAMMFGWTIVEPAPADAPTVTGFAKFTDQDTPLSFTTKDFTDHFTDPNVGQSLQSVQIVATPMHGVLRVNGVDVVAGQQIAVADLATLVYLAAAGYAGPDSFTWDGSDGTQYSTVPTMVSLVVDPLGSDLVTQWNLLVLGLNMPHGHAHMAGRLQAMMHAAIYDAAMAFDRTRAPYYATTPPPAGASMEAAATAAAYQVLYTEITDPTQRALIQARLDDHLAEIPAGQAKAAGIAFGQSVGEAIMILRGTDGAMMALLAEHPDGTLPGQWRRTASGAPMIPGWGNVTPWVMTSGNQFDQGGPPALTSAEYAADYEETRLWGDMNSTLRTPDQTATVMFWAHHPQPKWYAVARDISGMEHLTLAENAQLFHLLSMTLADATIAAWDTKYNYSFWRPETAIHLGDTDGNDATIADPTWQSLIAAPAFPEYFSGHSMTSAAAAKLLEFFFGTGDYTFHLSAMDMPAMNMPAMDMPAMNMPGARMYDSFWQAAEEVGQSRVYGGIHFQFSNQDALLAGSQLAQYVYATQSGDTTPPTVTINQAAGQVDPSDGSPLNFTVVFSESVFNFATGDVILSGTAGATAAAVTGSGTTYNVAVSGMTGNGTVIATIGTNAAQDAAGNPNTASTSTDNSVSYTVPPMLDLQAFTNGNFLDNFNTPSFSNSNGTTAWTTSWTETGDFGGVTAGQIQLDAGTGAGTNQLRFHGGNVANFNGASIQRVADLTGATSATLSFNYIENGVDGGETVLVQFAANGTNFTKLQTINTASNTGASNLALTGPFGSNSTLRFVVSTINSALENVQIDNVNISYTTPANDGSNNFAAAYTEDGAAVAIASGPEITGSGSPNLQSAAIVLTNAQAGDALSISGALPAGIASSLDLSVPGVITLNLTGAASLTAYQTALATVRFANSSQSPDTTPRTIQVTVNDGAVTSNVATATMTVISVDDPAILGADRLLLNAQNTNFVVPESAFLANDADPDTVLDITAVSAPVGLGTLSLTPGAITLSDTGTANGSFSYTAGGATANVAVVLDTGTMSGNATNEILVDGAGVNNTLSGNGGNDLILARDGNDTVVGGTGNDRLFGEAGNDTFTYAIGDGADAVDGGTQTTADTLNITGAGANDTLDVIYNGTALTSLEGGTLVDVEAVTANLGGGTDTLTYTGTTVPVTVNLGTDAASGFTTIASIENVAGGSGADTLTGSTAANVLNGGAGGDLLTGGDGNDTINTGAADDNVPDVVRWGAVAEFGDGDTVNNFDATGTTGQIDRVEFVSPALLALFDDGTALPDGIITWVTGDGTNNNNVVVNLNGTVEALYLSGANTEGVTTANLTSATAVTGEFNAEFALTAGNGEATLLVINDTNGNSAAVWRWVQAGGGEMAAGELTLIGIIHANATVTTGSVGVDLGTPLLAASVGGSSGTAGGRLNQTALQTVVRAAIADWASAGLSAELLNRMRSAQFVVTDMPGSSLGMTAGNTIYLDTNAAGHGWFVDRTPTRSEEFRGPARDGELRAVDRRAVDRMDLLTVVAHELGHVAGLDDIEAQLGSLMSSTLSAGVRRTAWSAAVDEVFGFGNVS